MLEELVDRRLLGDARRVHDDDLVGDLGDDAEVVGDHDDRGAVVVLQLVHQLEDLRLRRHVERRRRLVGDQQRSGSLTSAIAIITRWRMPPENWCG